MSILVYRPAPPVSITESPPSLTSHDSPWVRPYNRELTGRRTWNFFGQRMRHTSTLAVVVATALTAATGGAADWPQFRGPTGDGLYVGPQIPIEWGPDKNVV